jgi:hypothetical protein
LQDIQQVTGYGDLRVDLTPSHLHPVEARQKGSLAEEINTGHWGDTDGT